MALEEKARGQTTVVDVHQFPTTTLAMTVRDLVVRPDATAGAFTITLPPIAEAKGMFFSIIVQYASNTDLITITDNSDSEVWDGDFTLNEKGRGVIFYSDGMKWHYGSKHFTSSLVAGAVNLDEVHLIMDTAGAATVDAFIVRLESDVMLGNSAGAIFAQVNYDSSSAGISGLSYAIGAEMILPSSAAIPSGHYTCIDYEIGIHPAADWDPAGGTKVSYMRFAVWGTQTNFDDNGFWFTLAATEEVDHLVSVNAQTIRCQVEALTAGINKERFVVLSQTQNILHHNSTVLTGGYGMRVEGTMDDGVSIGTAAYFQANITGQPPGGGVVIGTGMWTNINEAPGSSIFRNIDAGVYSGISLADVDIYGYYCDMSLGAGGAPARALQFGFNHSGHALTAFFRAENAGAIAYDATDPTGGGGAADGRIKFQIGDNFFYLATYNA